jgi:hypothetical protein
MREQRADAEGDEDLAGLDRRFRDLGEARRRQAFDDDIAAPGKRVERHDFGRDPLRGEPPLGLGAIANRQCGEGEAGDAGGEGLGHRAADSPETGNADRQRRSWCRRHARAPSSLLRSRCYDIRHCADMTKL